MNGQQMADLNKAMYKTLSHHFKKAAAHHEAKADHHEKLMEAHKAHAEHHKDMIEKAKEAGQEHLAEHHKASYAFHKAKGGHHERLHKLHKAHAEHHARMGNAVEALEEGDAEKCMKTFGGTLSNSTTTAAAPAAQPAAAATAASNPAPAPAAAPAAAPIEAPIDIQKALEVKLGTAVEEGFQRILNSPEFNKRIDEVLQSLLLQKLGSTPTEVKSFAVPVPRGTNVPSPLQPGSSEASKVDPQFQDLVKVEG